MRPNESFVAQPVRSLQTMLRVIAKDNPKIPTVVPDGIYGPTTMSAITAFQRLYNIPITGVTDQRTWDKIVDVYEPARIRVDRAAPIEVLLEPGQILRPGDNSPYIFLLQGMLSYLSVNNTTLPMPTNSGKLDTETINSILAFQRIAALEETGEVDRLTWLYLVNYFTLSTHSHNKTF